MAENAELEQMRRDVETCFGTSCNFCEKDCPVYKIKKEKTYTSRGKNRSILGVLEGKVKARVGKQVETLQPGDAIYYDSKRPHLIKCLGKKPAKILAVLYAGLRSEGNPPE